MTAKMTTLALVSAAMLGLAGAAQAQNSGKNSNRANDPEMNHSTSTPSTMNSKGMSGKTEKDMGTTGQGMRSNKQIHDKTGNGGNGSPKAGGEGRVNSHTQQ